MPLKSGTAGRELIDRTAEAVIFDGDDDPTGSGRAVRDSDRLRDTEIGVWERGTTYVVMKLTRTEPDFALAWRQRVFMSSERPYLPVKGT